MVLQTGAFLGTTKKIFVGISTECLPVFWGTSPDTPGFVLKDRWLQYIGAISYLTNLSRRLEDYLII